MYKGKFVSELSMSEAKEYYDELRQKCPLTVEQWADFDMLKERLIVFAWKILDGKTNEKVLEAVFPKLRLIEGSALITETVIIKYWRVDENITVIESTDEWMNAPYKAGDEE